MSLLTAPRIHDGRNWLPENSVVEVADDGTITAIHDGAVIAQATQYHGILAPGFVNVHCHLELSHMKGVVPRHTGLIPFLQTIPRHRNDYTEEEKSTARAAAYNELVENGVVAVGDIANVADTLDVRAKDELHVHTFVESLGFSATPQKQFGFSEQVYEAFSKQAGVTKRLRQSIAPHAPYSVSEQLFRMIDEHNKTSLLSIHNQESNAEDEYYMLKMGAVQTLLHSLGIDDRFFVPSGKSSLQTYLQWLSPSHPFIFIHNTCTTRNDVQVAKTLVPETYWCFCPNANLYIENRLPDVDMFIAEGATICIGTDSLASNSQLSVLAELHALKHYHSHLDWETLLQWGTYNGACALQMQDIAGSLTPGTKPGILHITNLEDADSCTIHRII
ncbi:MAG: amidohydrolase family protein [Taibaiella sp.]|nr:amidohydrolase family protein [Taibaiella sp.]